MFLGHRVAPESYRAALAATTLEWSEEMTRRVHHCSKMTLPLGNGSLSVDEAVRRFRFTLSAAFGERLEIIGS